MDIIPMSAPEIERGNLEKSIREFRDYLVEVLALIDFTLSNQKNQIVGAVSEENFKQLAAAVAALSSQVSGISSMVSNLNTSISLLEDSVDSLETTVADHEKRIAALESTAT